MSRLIEAFGISSLLFAAGCTRNISNPSIQPNTLTRPQVREIIDANLANEWRSSPQTIWIPYGPLPRMFPGEKCNDDAYLPTKITVARHFHYIEAGLLDQQETKPCREWVLKLTALSKHDLVEEPSNSVNAAEGHIRSATFNKYAVTGIVQDINHATAEVEITYLLTASGLAWAKAGGKPSEKNCIYQNAESICSDSLDFTKFDDGWRIGEP